MTRQVHLPKNVEKGSTGSNISENNHHEFCLPEIQTSSSLNLDFDSMQLQESHIVSADEPLMRSNLSSLSTPSTPHWNDRPRATLETLLHRELSVSSRLRPNVPSSASHVESSDRETSSNELIRRQPLPAAVFQAFIFLPICTVFVLLHCFRVSVYQGPAQDVSTTALELEVEEEDDRLVTPVRDASDELGWVVLDGKRARDTLARNSSPDANTIFFSLGASSGSQFDLDITAPVLSTLSENVAADKGSVFDSPLKCCCQTKIDEMEEDYETASKIMERRYETEMANMTDDHEAELDELRNDARKRIQIQGEKTRKLHKLCLARGREIRQLKKDLRDVSNEYAFQASQFIELQRTFSRLQQSHDAIEKSALYEREVMKHNTRFLTSELQKNATKLQAASERENYVNNFLEQAQDEVHALRHQMSQATTRNKELEELVDATLTDRRLGFAPRQSFDLPCILRPDQVKDAEQALLTCQLNLKTQWEANANLAEEHTRTCKQLSTLTQRLQEQEDEFDNYKHSVQLSSDYNEAHERLAKRMGELVSDGKDDQELTKAIDSCVREEAKIEAQLRQNVDKVVQLRTSLRTMKDRYEKELADKQNEIGDLERQLRDLDKKNWQLENAQYDAQEHVEKLETEAKELTKSCTHLEAQVVRRAFGSDHDVVVNEFEKKLAAAATEIETLRTLLRHQHLNSEFYNQEQSLNAFNEYVQLDLCRKFRVQRDQAWARIAVFEERFREELLDEPLVVNFDKYKVDLSESEREIMDSINCYLYHVDGEKAFRADPKFLPKETDYEELRAAVAAEEKKRLEKEKDDLWRSFREGDDASWSTISEKLSGGNDAGN